MRTFCLILVSAILSSLASETGDITAFVTGWKTNKHGGIHRVNILSATSHTLKIKVRKEGEPGAMALNDVTGRIYWSDLNSEEIWSAVMDGSDQQRLVKLPEESLVCGITVDPVSQLLFYTDLVHNVITSVSTENSSISEVIIETGLYKPKGIVAYYEKGLLIWTNRVRYTGIEKSGYDGTGRTTLVRTNTDSPSSVTVDKTSDTLYWCDPWTKRVESVNLDGTERKLILTEPLSHYQGLYFFEGMLYLTDFLTNDLQLISLTGEKVKVMTFEVFGQSGGVAVTRLRSCPNGVYGYNCSSTCAHCRLGTVCNRIDGSCLRGCEEGWDNFRCDEVKKNDTDTSGAAHQMMAPYISVVVLLTLPWCIGTLMTGHYPTGM